MGKGIFLMDDVLIGDDVMIGNDIFHDHVEVRQILGLLLSWLYPKERKSPALHKIFYANIVFALSVDDFFDVVDSQSHHGIYRSNHGYILTNVPLFIIYP